MQKNQVQPKGFIPVRIYQSPSYIYLTCISKLPRGSILPECDTSLVVEQAMVSGLDEKLSPEDYQKRQQEAREILLKSQENLLTKTGLKEDTSDEEEEVDTDESEGMREPIRLKSEVLIKQYKKMYGPKPETKPEPTLKEILPLAEIKSGFKLALSFIFMACSIMALIFCGHENYFL